MIDVEKIARKALTIIKLKFGLPTSGFLAGGSIANLMWEIVSGNKAVINDVDIFLYTKDKSDQNIGKYAKVERSYFESYSQMSYTTETSDSYIINESTNNGIFNFVKYQSNNSSPDLIISSFDINCTRIGYSIDEDKFYYKDDFVQFLETGDLKITNLNTPAHTAIRIIKKKNDLNAKLNDSEVEICQYIISNRKQFPDIDKVRFMQRYANLYNLNKEYLDKFFRMEEDSLLEEWLMSTKNINEKIFKLITPNYSSDGIAPIFPNLDKSFETNRLHDLDFCWNSIKTKPTTAFEFLFYIRNIYNNSKLEDLWESLHYVYNSVDYMDIDASERNIKFLSDLLKSHPLIINNIRGMKFSEQLYLTKTIIYKISEQYDYSTAIAVLENKKLPKDIILDEDSCLLLGLSVRTKTKVVSGEFNGIVF